MNQWQCVALLVPLFLLGALLPACKDKEPSQANRTQTQPAASAQSTVSLLEEGEVDALRKTLAGIAAENIARVCERPLLRPGPALDGPADDDMLALLSEDGPMRDCLAKVLQVEASLPEDGRIVDLLRDQDGRAMSTTEASSISDAAQASIASIVSTCATMPSLLAKAVSHQDACSPFLPGRHGIQGLGSVTHQSKAAVLLSRKLADDGEVRKAVELLLDTMRFGQDLSRGGTSLLEPMIAFHLQEIIRPELDRQLDLLALADLEVIELQMALLYSSQPDRFEYIDGERNSSGIYTVWSEFEEAGWQPPGGSYQGERGSLSGAQTGGIDSKTSMALVWINADRYAKQQQARCPAKGRLQDCIDATEAYHKGQSEVVEPDIRSLLEHTSPSDKAARAALREAMLRALASIGGVPYTKYFIRMQTMKIALRAQLHKVRSRIAASKKKACPLALANTDDESNPQLVPNQGEFKLLVPQWILDRAENEQEKARLSRVLMHIRCS